MGIYCKEKGTCKSFGKKACNSDSVIDLSDACYTLPEPPLVKWEVLRDFKDDGAKDVLETYIKLHKDKIIGEHWLWCAVERIANGEKTSEVMEDYGYTYNCDSQLFSVECMGCGHTLKSMADMDEHKETCPAIKENKNEPSSDC